MAYDRRPITRVLEPFARALGSSAPQLECLVLLVRVYVTLRPTANESRKLKTAEVNYPVHERELPAVVHLLASCYLLPRRPYVRDNCSGCRARAACSGLAGSRYTACRRACRPDASRSHADTMHGGMMKQYRVQLMMEAHLMTWFRLREMSTSDRLFSPMLIAYATATEPAASALSFVASQAELSV